MATATAIEPEKSLWERVGRVGNLLNQGVESMVYGTLSLPALVADGYLNMYRTGRQAVGGEAFQASNMYEHSKQGLTDWGRKMDGSYGKVIGAQNATEQKIVFGAELVTGLVGPGALKSVKTLAEGTTVLNGAAAAAKPVAAAAAQTTAKTAAATAETAQATTAASTTAKTRMVSANEDALASLAKAKAEGEAARAGVSAAKAAPTPIAAAAETAATAGTVTQAAAKSVMSKWEIRSFLSREPNFPARLEHLSGHGAAAESKIAKLIAEARKEGVKGNDWTAIKTSRTLPQETIDSVGKVYNAGMNSTLPGKLGPAWERAKGSVAYAAAYPGSVALDVAGSAAKFSLITAPVTALKNPTLTVAGGAVGLVGYNYLADSTPASAFTAAATPGSPAAARNVSVSEGMAKAGTDTLIQVSKLTGASLITGAMLVAAKIPGVGDMALDGLRGSTRSLLMEMSDGETNEAAALQKAQAKLEKFLPSSHVATLTDFVKGKGVKDMSPEERIRVTDALEAVSSPHGDKAKALLNSTIAEAKQKVGPTVLGAVAGAAGTVAGVAGAAGDMADSALDAMGMDDIQGILGKVGGAAKNNPYAAAGAMFGAIYGFKQGTSKTDSMFKATFYAAIFGAAFQLIGSMYPGLMPALGKFAMAGADAAGIDTTMLKGKFEAASKGMTDAPTSAPAPQSVVPSGEQRVKNLFEKAGNAPEAAPAVKPAPTTGEDLIMNQFRNNSAVITETPETSRPAPVRRTPQFQPLTLDA